MDSVRLQAGVLAAARIRQPVKDLMLALFRHPAPADRSDSNSEYCPTLRQLAATLGKPYPASRRQIQYLIREAVRCGWLVVEKDSHKHGGPRSNRYRFLWGAIQWTATAATAPRPTRRRTAASGTPQDLAQRRAPGGASVRPASVYPPAIVPEADAQRCALSTDLEGPIGAENALRHPPTDFAPPRRKLCATPAQRPPPAGEAAGETPRAFLNLNSESERSEVQIQRTDQESRMVGGWFVRVADLTDPAAVQRLYLQAVGYGWFPESEQNRIGVFAAAIQARKGKRPERLFTSFLTGQGWNDPKRISETTIDVANKAVQQFDASHRSKPIPDGTLPRLAGVADGSIDMEARRRKLLDQLDLLKAGSVPSASSCSQGISNG